MYLSPIISKSFTLIATFVHARAPQQSIKLLRVSFAFFSSFFFFFSSVFCVLSLFFFSLGKNAPLLRIYVRKICYA